MLPKLIILICLVLVSFSANDVASAQSATKSLADITIVFAPEKLVCKGGSYADGTCSSGMTSSEFNKYKKLSRQRAFFAASSARKAFDFNKSISFQSRQSDRYGSQISAIVEFAWKTPRPQKVYIEKRDNLNGGLGDDYASPVVASRSYYHFSSSYIYQMVMSIRAMNPEFTITLSGQ